MRPSLVTLSSIGFSLLIFSSPVKAQFIEGRDYVRTAVVGKTVDPKKIEVREFFWYGCGYCYRLEPHMQAWLKKMPADVVFARTPAPINPVWESNARGYYVAEALGIRQKTHLALFHEIHVKGDKIFDQASQAKFFTRYGVTEADFNKHFQSFAVSSKVAEAKQLTMQYKLQGVPAVVVNGKYIVNGADAKVTQVVDYLVEKERQALKN
ncbi:thiol:disulfide interchange protein DsbA/DsbL [Acinetobacter rudis]|uniref:Thiol:disulfide interchange protein n=1 Tax=Acinetobacter rudis CIP 110305 TaxID=421052 RepID=S3MVL1_9GAMM|nr:thiol:disulfide interchange protein DsbA/DsbL [Acinetobacter rudis]EPF71547.1 thiol:disulfide interchange protein DsbA [Acinetobacter rudis CIP 110305]